MAKYIAHSSIDERGKATGGQAGDQTGKEVLISAWYSRPWNQFFRIENDKVRKQFGNNMIDLANNPAVGYNQNQRNTLLTQAEKVNFNFSKITTKCNSDCSSGVTICLLGAIYTVLGKDAYNRAKAVMVAGGNCATTSSFKGRVAGLTDVKVTLYTSTAYTGSTAKAVFGDIYNKSGSHIVAYVDDDKKVGLTPATTATTTTSKKEANVKAGQKWLNTNYGTLIKKHKGALLDLDGSYGPKTRAAALCVWKDVVNRKYGFSLTPSNENFLNSCVKAASKATIKSGDHGTLTLIAQLILSSYGYYTSDMDCKFNAKLVAATKAFQKKRGLDADGIIGPKTWNALFN